MCASFIAGFELTIALQRCDSFEDSADWTWHTDAAMGTTAVASSFAEPSMYPLHRCKIIHVVRHGQGYHNVAGNVDLKNYESWDFVDASLTELGWRQTEALHEHLVKTHIRNHVELVVVSPLLRTLQTAVGVWGGGTLLDGEPPHSALMRSEVGQYRHPAVSSAGDPPFLLKLFNVWVIVVVLCAPLKQVGRAHL